METIENKIETNDNSLIIETTKEFKKCLGLLKYCIEQKIRNSIRSKEEVIQDILNGKSIYNVTLESQTLSVPNNMIIIYESSYKGEILNILLDENKKRKELIISLEKYIVILTSDENKYKYLDLIEEVNIKTNKNHYISYGKIGGLSDLKERFDYLVENINICIRYNLEVKTYKENELILERSLDSISESEKKKICTDYNKILSKLDEDLTNTIDIFIKEGLNASNAAEKLYIHRNTLFYRIDKIKKIVNYDITNFNQAIEFKIIFNLWRANKNKYII